MTQKVLQRIEIYQTIIAELKKSKVETLLVSAWFSDEKLFNILLEKQKQGVQVKLIMEDFITNEKIRFSDLTKAGDEIYKVEKGDLSMIHEKYCVIDGKIAIITLFNWSTNVLLESIESVIMTDNNNKIQNLKTRFYGMANVGTRIGTNRNIDSLISKIKNGVFRFLGIEVEQLESTENQNIEK